MIKNTSLIKNTALISLFLVSFSIFFDYYSILKGHEFYYSLEKGYNNGSDYWFTISITFIAFVAVFFHIFTKSKFKKNILVTVMLMEGFLFASFYNAGLNQGLWALISIPIVFIYLLEVIKKVRLKKVYITFPLYLHLIWAITPVFIYAANPQSEIIINELNQFIGLSSSRTTYGYLASISFAFIVVYRPKFWTIFIPILLVGIMLSSSRAPILAILISSLYVVYYDKRIKYKKIMLGILMILTLIFFSLFLFYSERVALLDLEGNLTRLLIYKHHLQYAAEHILFGAGGPYVSDSIEFINGNIKYGKFPAHNFFLETLTSFGMFVVISWLALLIFFWSKLHPMGRVFMLIYIVYGMVHNGFGLSVLNPNMFFIMFITVMTSNFFKQYK